MTDNQKSCQNSSQKGYNITFSYKKQMENNDYKKSDPSTHFKSNKKIATTK